MHINLWFQEIAITRIIEEIERITDKITTQINGLKNR